MPKSISFIGLIGNRIFELRIFSLFFKKIAPIDTFSLDLQGGSNLIFLSDHFDRTKAIFAHLIEITVFLTIKC